MAPETLGNKKQRCKAGTDMINNLPSNLVQQILESLPLTDAARTSVLSRDWRYKWLSVPHITLDLRFSEALRKRENAALDFPRVYSDAVNKIFLRHRGPILKFIFHVPCHLPKASDIDCWIEFVCSKGVKEFYLYDHRLPKLKPPSCLFSCVSLTHLTLFCGSLSLPPTFGGFPCLISLKLHTCEDDNKKLESLIHDCPQLQSLDLSLDEAISCLTIRALKLQDLVLSATVPRLRLEETARIRTLALDIGGVDLEICDMVELLGSLPNIEKLQLSYFYGCQLHPPRALTKRLERLHTLVLGMPLTCHYTISLLLCLFKSCPSLSRIQIEALKCGSCGSKMLEVEGSCRLECLKHVELLSISGLCSEMKLVKFLLGHSPVLEFMSIGINKLAVKGSEAKLNLAKEVMRYRRVSPYAEVDLKP